ncbi:hypothetical protein ACFLY4_07495 [Chloroflexota bacterium]
MNLVRMILLVLLVFLIGCYPAIEQVPTKPEGSADFDPGSTLKGAPTQTSAAGLADESDPAPVPVLPNHGPTPELTSDVWLNSDHPLRLAELRGKVVLLEMWTFG